MVIDTGRAGATYEFGILGPLEVRSNGVALPLGGRQQRAILALLLVEDGRAVSLDRIADELWGEKVPASYQTTVQTYVFHLRQVLEPERTRGTRGAMLVRDGAGYRLLTNAHTVDARHFGDTYARGRSLAAAGHPAAAPEQLDEALGLWRGDVLADLGAFGFVQPVATRLGELRVAAEEARIDARLTLGQHAEAVSELDGLIARNPLHERFHCQRMLALYRLGRQGETLAGYRSLPTGSGRSSASSPGLRPRGCTSRSWGRIPSCLNRSSRPGTWWRHRRPVRVPGVPAALPLLPDRRYRAAWRSGPDQGQSPDQGRPCRRQGHRGRIRR